MSIEKLSPSLHKANNDTGLWQTIFAPTVWAVHFLLCYCITAIYCEKWFDGTDFVLLSWGLGGITLIALIAIGISACRLLKVRGRSAVGNDTNFSHSSRKERHHFLTHVALMLSVLSAIAIIYVFLPVIFLENCR